MNQRIREIRRRNKAQAAVDNWAARLSDHELAAELASLRKKCQAEPYRSGLAAHMLAAAEDEENKRHPSRRVP